MGLPVVVWTTTHSSSKMKTSTAPSRPSRLTPPSKVAAACPSSNVQLAQNRLRWARGGEPSSRSQRNRAGLVQLGRARGDRSARPDRIGSEPMKMRHAISFGCAVTSRLTATAEPGAIRSITSRIPQAGSPAEVTRFAGGLVGQPSTLNSDPSDGSPVVGGGSPAGLAGGIGFGSDGVGFGSMLT